VKPVTLITGASAGIGAELARVFAKHGHELVALAVGIDDFPHHLDDLGAAVFIERAVEQMGEMIEVD
jgi:NADP-dependent 3-hydroxy acid dehydrogenase YdfG